MNKQPLRRLFVFSLAMIAGASAHAAGPLDIAMISKGIHDQFSQAVMEGAMRASRDNNVVVTFEGPESDPMVDGQVDVLSAALARNPAAVCIDALDSNAVTALLRKAQKARIPVIGFDSGVDGPIPITTAATDNVAAGAMAASKMAALIGGSGKVGVMVHDQTTRTGADRRDGFLNEMTKRHPGIQIIGPEYGEGDQLKTMMQANPDIKGFFGASEGSAIGIVKAAQELDMTARLVIIGFGSGKALGDAIRSGLVAGAVTEDPIRIGSMAVDAAVKVLRGKKVPRTIDTGFHWYDRTNIDDPAIAILLDQ